MQEILPGLWHWQAFNPSIRTDVGCHWLEPAGALIDPLLPSGGIEAFEAGERPSQVVLTSGLHTRDSARFAEVLGCAIRVSRPGAERIGGALAVETYEWGEEVAPGVTALEVGVLCPDEGALHLDVDAGALAIADGITRYRGELGFVPDSLLGDDAEGVKRGLKARYAELLEEREFDHLLFAHGEPLVGGGRAALEAFVSG